MRGRRPSGRGAAGADGRDHGTGRLGPARRPLSLRGFLPRRRASSSASSPTPARRWSPTSPRAGWPRRSRCWPRSTPSARSRSPRADEGPRGGRARHGVGAGAALRGRHARRGRVGRGPGGADAEAQAELDRRARRSSASSRQVRGGARRLKRSRRSPACRRIVSTRLTARMSGADYRETSFNTWERMASGWQRSREYVWDARARSASRWSSARPQARPDDPRAGVRRRRHGLHGREQDRRRGAADLDRLLPRA